MDTKELLELKRSNLQKAVNRQEPDFVPNMLYNHTASTVWAGKRTIDVLEDPQAYVDALTAFCADVWIDANIMCGNPMGGTPRLVEAVENPINTIGPDGTTPEHLQRSTMKPDEYDQMAADFYRYVNEVTLPRVHPQMFEDREKTKNMLKVYAEERLRMMVQYPAMVDACLAEKYGIPAALNMQQNFMTPLDVLFDYFRGFRGTLTDLRRQRAAVEKVLDTIWEVRCKPALSVPFQNTGLWAPQMPHIPAYLSPKQFEELYWPHQKQQIMHIAEGGGKAYIILEGRWKQIWHHFLELPKDCCVLAVDDDDIFEIHEAIGHHQILAGGLRTSDTRLKTFEQMKDDVKRVIDTCAPGGGFLFCTDKAWIAPGDVNQTLIDAYNFAHEYSKK